MITIVVIVAVVGMGMWGDAAFAQGRVETREGKSGSASAADSLRRARSMEEARRDVGYLASREAKGRGYYHRGDRAAAGYIAGRFRALGLDSFSVGYLQPFPMTVNEFPSAPALKVNGRELRFGRDYLVSETSGSGTGKGKVLWCGYGLAIPKRAGDLDRIESSGALVAIDGGLPDSIGTDTTIDRRYKDLDFRVRTIMRRMPKGVIALVDNLVLSRSDDAFPAPFFKILRSAIPSGIDSIELSVRNDLVDVTTQNVVAWLPGTHRRDSMIIICAHYDHLGAFGDSLYFPGANDNASGVAMLLGLARYFRECPPKYSIAFIAFSGEEAGLLGSRHFVEHPMFDFRKARFLINLDMTASGKDGIMAVGGVDFPEEFALLQKAAATAGLSDVRKRPNVPNSDHYFFIDSGVRGFYIYPFTGYQPYHHIDDRPETLEWDVFERMRDIVVGFLEGL